MKTSELQIAFQADRKGIERWIIAEFSLLCCITEPPDNCEHSFRARGARFKSRLHRDRRRVLWCHCSAIDASCKLFSRLMLCALVLCSEKSKLNVHKRRHDASRIKENKTQSIYVNHIKKQHKLIQKKFIMAWREKTVVKRFLRLKSEAWIRLARLARSIVVTDNEPAMSWIIFYATRVRHVRK